MNIISFLGDVLHLASFFILLVKMFASKSAKGISLRTQFLYVVVFVTRYLDLIHFVSGILSGGFPNLIHFYLALMKCIYISASSIIVFLIYRREPWSRTYDKKTDKVRIEMLVIPCLLFALIWNEKFSVKEVLYTFSLWLEAVAIIPQLYMVQQYARKSGGFVENLTSHYVFSLGGYRALYLVNWIYRLLTETGYWHPIIWVTGTIQTGIYADFFYYYLTSRVKGKQMSLPV